MTEREWTILGDYLRWMANEMGLRDWSFTLDRAAAPDDSNAEVWPCAGRKHATIKVCADFRELKPDEQRMSVVHELTHCHLVLATDCLRLDMEKALGEHMQRPLWEIFHRLIEYGVDGIAVAWAEKMPLIDWEQTDEPNAPNH